MESDNGSNASSDGSSRLNSTTISIDQSTINLLPNNKPKLNAKRRKMNRFFHSCCSNLKAGLRCMCRRCDLIIATIFMILAAGAIVVELIIQQYHGILVLALFFFANALVFVAKSTREVWLFCPLATFLFIGFAFVLGGSQHYLMENIKNGDGASVAGFLVCVFLLILICCIAMIFLALSENDF